MTFKSTVDATENVPFKTHLMGVVYIGSPDREVIKGKVSAQDPPRANVETTGVSELRRSESGSRKQNGRKVSFPGAMWEECK